LGELVDAADEGGASSGLLVEECGSVASQRREMVVQVGMA
jgi:hypothetical protein